MNSETASGSHTTAPGPEPTSSGSAPRRATTTRQPARHRLGDRQPGSLRAPMGRRRRRPGCSSAPCRLRRRGREYDLLRHILLAGGSVAWPTLPGRSRPREARRRQAPHDLAPHGDQKRQVLARLEAAQKHGHRPTGQVELPDQGSVALLRGEPRGHAVVDGDDLDSGTPSSLESWRRENSLTVTI